ncbi:methyltransferase domain-containing protein [Candidatus Berkiella aquae]|uniref:Class I SAM-dependent methyltransferase n=1 Tax=Candidatus Berkiella aquae TaxID=295108 RepID=A0A0Q9YVD8_9GAMM|nr:class I SAM-dependent methyltransferase [Candidatus Berkiella aquae]MCS5711323.1 class I SAM-dependent methyltransferase [Candidatus Berkiella aquae]
MTYIQHFAQNSGDYLQYRPDYPEALFQFLADLCGEHQLAWDCATGNGQAALPLAKYFKQVIASDINQQPLNVALQNENIAYYCWPAEQTELQPRSVDLITVAQALHWFDLPSFYEEVRRVAKPKAIIAAWCYSLGSVSPEVDRVIHSLYHDILGDTFWPKERRYIDKEYKTIAFPFKKKVTSTFHAEKNFQLASLIGYLRTWSAVKEYQQRLNQDPIQLIFNDLEQAWGKSEKVYTMQWPLHLLVGRI